MEPRLYNGIPVRTANGPLCWLDTTRIHGPWTRVVCTGL